METKIIEIAERIRGLRILLDMTQEQVADATGVSLEEYSAAEAGEADFSFTFLYKCAQCFRVDIVDILTGTSPKLSSYSLIRKDQGLPIKRRKGFTYLHLAPFFKGKLAEPFLVTAPYIEEEQNQPVALSKHKGQELDFIVKGTLKVVIDGHTEVLHEGDTIYYDSGQGHGMIAADGEPCEFLAIVFKNPQD